MRNKQGQMMVLFLVRFLYVFFGGGACKWTPMLSLHFPTFHTKHKPKQKEEFSEKKSDCEENSGTNVFARKKDINDANMSSKVKTIERKLWIKQGFSGIPSNGKSLVRSMTLFSQQNTHERRRRTFLVKRISENVFSAEAAGLGESVQKKDKIAVWQRSIQISLVTAFLCSRTFWQSPRRVTLQC